MKADPLNRQPDNMDARFRYLAALYTIGDASTEDIIDCADQALKQGIYHDFLLGIMDAKPKIGSEIMPLFRSYCIATKIPIDDYQWSIFYLLRHFLTRVSFEANDAGVELNKMRTLIGPSALRHLDENREEYGLQ